VQGALGFLQGFVMPLEVLRGKTASTFEHVSTHTITSHLLQTSVMVLPKSMRLLALLCLGIFGYLLFLIFSAPVDIQPPPSTGKLDKMTKDPNLDRTVLFGCVLRTIANCVSHWRASRAVTESCWKQLRPGQPQLGAHQCHPPLSSPQPRTERYATIGERSGANVE
jgi:hypothetical protein